MYSQYEMFAEDRYEEEMNRKRLDELDEELRSQGEPPALRRRSLQSFKNGFIRTRRGNYTTNYEEMGITVFKRADKLWGYVVNGTHRGTVFGSEGYLTPDEAMAGAFDFVCGVLDYYAWEMNNSE